MEQGTPSESKTSAAPMVPPQGPILLTFWTLKTKTSVVGPRVLEVPMLLGLAPRKHGPSGSRPLPSPRTLRAAPPSPRAAGTRTRTPKPVRRPAAPRTPARSTLRCPSWGLSLILCFSQGTLPQKRKEGKTRATNALFFGGERPLVGM